MPRALVAFCRCAKRPPIKMFEFHGRMQLCRELAGKQIGTIARRADLRRVQPALRNRGVTPSGRSPVNITF